MIRGLVSKVRTSATFEHQASGGIEALGRRLQAERVIGCLTDQVLSEVQTVPLMAQPLAAPTFKFWGQISSSCRMMSYQSNANEIQKDCVG